ncbi:hypothetical protein [Vibrio alginolyticus]|uniref:hypothetical protein n=1 Tax=Vibrio alginolyticus TaxID=663 RepID=UPI0009BEB7E0|nr:hypothetical protein [Vibrio alginolyticus]
MNHDDPWICLNDDDDCTIERFEVRLKGRKPLVIEKPTTDKMITITITKQYLNLSLPQTHLFLTQAVLNTPDPLTIDEHFKLIDALEKSLAQRVTSDA